jgi:cystathionine beta-lyase
MDLFDETVERRATGAIKYMHEKYRVPADTIPMWVADMDIKVPSCVTEALIKLANHGIFGYTEATEGYKEAVHSWFLRRFNWNIDYTHNVPTPGVVFALATALNAYTSVGDAVIIQQPVYSPFYNLPHTNGRRVIVSELVIANNRYEIDFDDFERKIQDNNVKLFFLCSPHNPGGRVWSRGELERLACICLKHKVLIVSDEIHADFVYTPNKHTILAALSPEISDITITCTAPSKTFNLAGLQISNTFISNDPLRKSFIETYNRSGYSQLNTAGYVACEAAYKFGDEWLDALIIYLAQSTATVKDGLVGTPLTLMEPEGTYLLWLDCRKLGITDKELTAFLFNKAKLWLNIGTIFGPSGSGFARMNIACPKKTVETAINRLVNALG